jgi:hypothetical protein
MGSKIAVAVLHCSLGLWTLIIKQGVRLRDNLYVNTTLYATPKVPKDEYELQLNAAISSQAAAAKGGVEDTALYHEDTTKLFVMLDTLLNYVNGLYKGDKVKLLASGFDVVDEAVPQDIPSVPVVSRMEAGNQPHSVRFIIKRTPATPGKKRRGVTYIIEMTTTPDDEKTFKPVLIIDNQFKLLVTNLTRGTEYSFRLAAKNARGQSDWTEIFTYIAQ